MIDAGKVRAGAVREVASKGNMNLDRKQGTVGAIGPKGARQEKRKVWPGWGLAAKEGQHSMRVRDLLGR